MHDGNLDERLRAAFDAMGPSPQAEARMLAKLQAACAAKERTRRRVWKVALPAAACLVLVAGVGALALGTSGILTPLGAGSQAGMQSESLLNSVTSGAEPEAASSGADDGTAGRAGEEAPEASGAAPSDEAAGASAGAEGTVGEEALHGLGGGDVDARYPFVALDSGEKARIALGEDGPLAASDEARGELLGDAQASSPLEEATAACTVYASLDPDHPYVVRFNETGQLYFADRTEE